MGNELDTYVARFQNLPGYNLHSIVSEGMASAPWYQVDMKGLCAELVVNELTLPEQLGVISAEIQKWGRLTALAKRVWELNERLYRAWRSKFILTVIDPPEKAKDWKKPTEAVLEAMYRIDPQYHVYQIKIEEAEEAYNSTEAVLQAFRAKKDVLLGMRKRYHEDGAA